MSLLERRMQTRSADKAQALGEVATLLALIDSEQREPNTWERLCLLRAFSLIAAGCYGLALLETRELAAKPRPDLREMDSEPVLEACTLGTLFEALKEAMAEEARLYPHLGPLALG